MPEDWLEGMGLLNIMIRKSLVPLMAFMIKTWDAMATSDSDLISRSVVSNSLRPHESQHARPACSSPTPRVHWDSRPLSQWCHPAISSSVVPFSSCSQSLPASESFPMSQLFEWGGQSNPRADLFQNGLVGSPCSPRDYQESSPTPQFKSINSSVLSLLHSTTLTSIPNSIKRYLFSFDS